MKETLARSQPGLTDVACLGRGGVDQLAFKISHEAVLERAVLRDRVTLGRCQRNEAKLLLSLCVVLGIRVPDGDVSLRCWLPVHMLSRPLVMDESPLRL